MPLLVPQGHLLRYDYVATSRFRGFKSYGAMQRDVIVEKMGRFSEANGDQYADDAPVVEWTADGGFLVLDGRHAFVALLATGYSTLLVRWLEEEAA